jgi:hypothetical protein
LLTAISLSILLTLGQASALQLPPGANTGADPYAAAPVEPPRDDKYAGMSLGPEARNPLPAPKDDPPRLTWTGFSAANAGGEIFLQTTRQVVHEMTVSNGPGGRPTLSVFLRNCRIHMKNNARRIDTSFFATPVDGIVARQKRKDVELSIRLKEAVTPEVRITPGPDGTQLLVLAFPAGSQPAAAGAPDAPAAATAPSLPPAQLSPPPTSDAATAPRPRGR